MPFDIEQFKKAPITGAFETDFVPPPEDTYKAEIVKYDVFQVSGVQAHNQGVKYTSLEVVYKLEDAQGKLKALGLDSATAKQKIRLDLTPDEKGLAAGVNKNLDLGRLQAALGIKDVKQWTFDMLVGKKATVQTKVEKINSNGKDWQQAVVTSVAPYNAPNGAAAPGSASIGMPARPAGR